MLPIKRGLSCQKTVYTDPQRALTQRFVECSPWPFPSLRSEGASSFSASADGSDFSNECSISPSTSTFPDELPRADGGFALLSASPSFRQGQCFRRSNLRAPSTRLSRTPANGYSREGWALCASTLRILRYP